MKVSFQSVTRIWIGALVILSLTACQSAYYSAMESVGVHKRDILVDEIQETEEAQQEAQQAFKSALEQLTQLINFDGGDLKLAYEALNEEYENSEAKAKQVSNRIDAIDDVGEALFDEWREELNQYSNASLKRKSEQTLKDTERKYERLLKSMRRAEKKMDPVLNALRDNTLFLKHNLNAAAVDAIGDEFGSLKKDIDALIQDMNSAISESQKFVDELQKSAPAA